MKKVSAAALAVLLLCGLPLEALALDRSAGGDRGKPETHARSRAKPVPAQIVKIAATLRAEVRKCWIVPRAVQAVEDRPTIVIVAALDRKGRVSGTPQVVDGEGRPELQQLMAESAVKALRMCQPYSVAKRFPQFHHIWKEIRLRFDPREK